MFSLGEGPNHTNERVPVSTANRMNEEARHVSNKFSALQLTILVDDVVVEWKNMRCYVVGKLHRLRLLCFHGCNEVFHVSNEESVWIPIYSLLPQKFLQLPRP